MIYSGMASITFRKLMPREIAELTAKAELDGIEWGGDVHVPPGDLKTARETGRMTREQGLAVASYGSYYRIWEDGRDAGAFQQVMETALALGAPNIRVWAGTKGSREADEDWRSAVAEESRRIAAEAELEGITVSYEYHGGTLTDTRASARQLMESAGHPNLYTYWQPPVVQEMTERLSGLLDAAPWLSNLHVYHWIDQERMPLTAGRNHWAIYFQEAAKVPGDRYALLEFVKENDLEQFMMDAVVLKELLTACNERASSGGRHV